MATVASATTVVTTVDGSLTGGAPPDPGQVDVVPGGRAAKGATMTRALVALGGGGGHTNPVLWTIVVVFVVVVVALTIFRRFRR
jgi:hypothetical protein